MEDREDELVAGLYDSVLHLFEHPLPEEGVAVGDQIDDGLVHGVGGARVVIFALVKESLQRLKHQLTVGLVEPVVILAELLFKKGLILIGNLLHILFV
jgi:hypothetical protein